MNEIRSNDVTHIFESAPSLIWSMEQAQRTLRGHCTQHSLVVYP